MSRPATRSNSTSIPTTSSSGDDGWTPPGGTSARTQTHALYGSNQGHPRTPRHTPQRARPRQCVTTSPDGPCILIPKRGDSRSPWVTPHAFDVPELVVTGSLEVASDAEDMRRESSASYRARRQERERQRRERAAQADAKEVPARRTRSADGAASGDARRAAASSCAWC